jgi:ABC-2 type transport system ATP-binding protein
MSAAAISVSGLRKSYGRHEAVRGIDLEVQRGEIFAFLGPNGAGKTTTVEILEGYRERNAGDVSVLGADPADVDLDWHARVGIVLQECRMEPKLTVRETLEMFAGYYANARDVTETIELVGLSEKADQRAGKLSGGQQRRLDVGVALVGDAELLFLDEPTTGFDPSARRHFWDVISGLRELGKTVFLTTHYMDEAQALADRVAVIRGGEIVATGTPDDLGGRGDAASVISFALPIGAGPGELPDAVGAATSGSNGTLSLETTDPVAALNALTGWALERGVALDALEVRRPSLEDVYLELTSSEASTEPVDSE